MSTVLSMAPDRHPLSDEQVEYAALLTAMALASGAAVWVTDEEEHPGEVGLSLTDDDGHPTGQVVVVVQPDDVVLVGLPLPTTEELVDAKALAELEAELAS